MLSYTHNLTALPRLLARHSIQRHASVAPLLSRPSSTSPAAPSLARAPSGSKPPQTWAELFEQDVEADDIGDSVQRLKDAEVMVNRVGWLLSGMALGGVACFAIFFRTSRSDKYHAELGYYYARKGARAIGDPDEVKERRREAEHSKAIQELHTERLLWERERAKSREGVVKACR
ncbi:hypothetical protein JCM10207_003639 [Rhodosporidiobolus poonsookiae]